ncbi:hypothetical protein LguiA_011883 [Lonicera macranthoides]
MGSKICMNQCCGTTMSLDWRRGWGLKSGGFATLCYSCGLAYENSTYCDKFHLDETGWRECKYCRKHIHCGCIASKNLHEYLDFGGVGCTRCIRDLELQLIRTIQAPTVDILNRFGTLISNVHPQSSVLENRVNSDTLDKAGFVELLQLGKSVEQNEPDYFLQPHKADQPSSSNGRIKQEENLLTTGGISGEFIRPSIFSRPSSSKTTLGLKDMYESLAQQSLRFSLGAPLSTPNTVLPFSDEVVEGTEKDKVPQFQELQKSRLNLPKPPKAGVGIRAGANKGMDSQTRVPRPPGEGRGRNQLLPRYWPRITDQELQQLSGDLNSTIVPLFEKVLSASDAGRIGRLVLPKACAEAYFPPIFQSEGLPIRIQDIKGKEWTFQFRFWPNNNSRMYVLEGVTPCIQNMQLQAGDTVTFSKVEPGGKLVMGYRKATNSVDVQEPQTSAIPSGDLSDVNKNLTTDSFNWPKNEENEGTKDEDSIQRPILIPEKRRARNIGSKSKRLLINSDDAKELTLSWEEAQQLLRPPLRGKPTVVMVENHAFEEYDAPPVIGKKTMFTARESGEEEQWGQCDSCFKWRRLPLDVLLPPKWNCSENIWDSNKCSCSAVEEINPMKLQSCFESSKDCRRRRTMENTAAQEGEPSGLDALVSAAALGDKARGSGQPLVGAAATTRHPRHRPGCSCIVCIQPPSGKGKHKPSCDCNVCLTVRRRFKTLMLRKRKRQSDREAEITRAQGQSTPKDAGQETDDALGHVLGPVLALPHMSCSGNGNRMETSEPSKGHLDLNSDPNRDDDYMIPETEETLTFGMFSRQNGVSGFGPCLLSKAATKIEVNPTNEGRPSAIDPGRGNVGAGR